MVIENVNHIKLLAEFDANGIAYNKESLLNNMEYDNDGIPLSNVCNLTIEFADNVDMTLVQTIIDAHDPTPLPQSLSETEQLRLEMARSNAEMFETVLSLLGGM